MKKQPHADKWIFLVCLVTSIGLFVGGFFCPPRGAIDGSILKATGIMFLYAALAVAGQNLANGKDVSFRHDKTELNIGEDKEGKE
jgi:hypothetical protein